MTPNSLEEALAWADSAVINTPFLVTNKEREFAKVLAAAVRDLQSQVAKVKELYLKCQDDKIALRAELGQANNKLMTMGNHFDSLEARLSQPCAECDRLKMQLAESSRMESRALNQKDHAMARLETAEARLAKCVEDCAKFVESYLIYMGPGGVDPEPIQKAIAKALRAQSALEKEGVE